MPLNYDADADALYIKLTDKAIVGLTRNNVRGVKQVARVEYVL